ncbi:hypothetical protein Pcar_3412 [Syntrophotalea carbinolica DSM 2380]|uniref:Uncharacterized protein n=1 Tax=Syntrophotalea carbinolica (strain DSM 2380 / NBRC 103641 / GraBd1) TaxID=338963 RepID=Q0C6B2_SYNC1|nr:hypothetical protein Pcar_3412 [Syntrophotalea carbinolica DSM 2380]
MRYGKIERASLPDYVSLLQKPHRPYMRRINFRQGGSHRHVKTACVFRG